MESIVHTILTIFITVFFFYLASAGIFYFILNVRFKERFSDFRFNPRPAKAKVILGEFKSSLVSMGAISTMLCITYLYMIPSGKIRIYSDFSEHGLGYYVFTFLFVAFVYDSFVYWMHRLLHIPLLFKLIHRKHHSSQYPTAWGSHSTHVLEIVLYGQGLVLGLMVFPVHQSMIPVQVGISFIWSIYQHCGFDLFNLRKKSLLGNVILGSAADHAWHHVYVNGNYGMFSNFWDYLARTQKPGIAPAKDRTANVGASKMKENH